METREGEHYEMSEAARGSSLQWARCFGEGEEIMTCVGGTSVTSAAPSALVDGADLKAVGASFVYQSSLEPGTTPHNIVGDGVTPFAAAILPGAARCIEVESEHAADSYAQTAAVWGEYLML